MTNPPTTSSGDACAYRGELIESAPEADKYIHGFGCTQQETVWKGNRIVNVPARCKCGLAAALASLEGTE